MRRPASLWPDQMKRRSPCRWEYIQSKPKRVPLGCARHQGSFADKFDDTTSSIGPVFTVCLVILSWCLQRVSTGPHRRAVLICMHPIAVHPQQTFHADSYNNNNSTACVFTLVFGEKQKTNPAVSGSYVPTPIHAGTAIDPHFGVCSCCICFALSSCLHDTIGPRYDR